MSRRLLVALFALAQLALVAAAPLADAPPVATPSHAPLLAAESLPGCDPVHDHLHCIFCRVLSTEPVAHAVGAGAPMPVPGIATPLAAPAATPATRPDPHSLNARAPPRA